MSKTVRRRFLADRNAIQALGLGRILEDFIAPAHNYHKYGYLYLKLPTYTNFVSYIQCARVYSPQPIKALDDPRLE